MKTIYDDMTNKELAKFAINLFHRTIIHYGLWFSEVKRQIGSKDTYSMLNDLFQRNMSIQMKRYSKILGFELEDDIPKALIDMPREKLISLLDGIAINWLVNDGVWFQGVESKKGMNDAKRCNDSCWGQFSPAEAICIKDFAEIGDNAGLKGLETALQLRLYSRINKQKIVWESDSVLCFYMTECRVQAARKRKNLEDYPCKSAGLVEYPYFAKTIDEKIKTECISCPPDKHPDDWYCAWRFTIEQL